VTDFWLSCGHHLLDRDEGGGLVVTDDFLRIYLARPELVPPPEACVVERTLHAALLADPRRSVSGDEIAEIADPDARENWQVMLAFRDHLTGHRTLEAAYCDLMRKGIGRTPPLFVDQLVHVILRNVLDECDDGLMLRAAELFFREQRVTLHDGSLLAADEEAIDALGEQPITPLVAMMGFPAPGQIDILREDNAQSYWERSDRFDTAIDLTAGRAGVAALGRVMRAWIRHLLAVDVVVEPLTELRDVNLSWYVGLDTNGTRIGDALWNGDALDDTASGQIVALYRLTFDDPAMMTETVRGEPAYLILAMTSQRRLRMKPQNLVVGLPIARREAVS
jgi:Family of unknown function (DUF6352)